jgi:hypothetical protein
MNLHNLLHNRQPETYPAFTTRKERVEDPWT